MSRWADWAATDLAGISLVGRSRSVRTFDALGPQGRLPDGHTVTSFASNDYLGLSCHPAVVAAAHAALDRWGTGATASRLVVGSRPVHDRLEEALAAWKGTERALLFPTGYAANLGLLGALGGSDCLVISDERNHASIIDGCRLSRSEVAISRHNDVAHVDALLSDAPQARAMVVVDSVFSMDGDEAPVVELAEVCARHDALLVLDDAHAVLGPESPAADATIVRVVTMSKALGAMGGAVCGPAPLIEVLVNRARSAIFTTALSPADAAAALAAVDVVTGLEGVALIKRLRALVCRVAPGHPSPIVPLIVGDERAAVAASDALLELGLLVPAIRPPTVEPGTSRLRVALSAAHSDDMVHRLCDGLAAIGLSFSENS